MKLSGIKKIVTEDFKSEMRDTVQRLAQVLNPFLDQVTRALSGNLTIAENLKSKQYNLILPVGTSTYTVAWDLNERPTDVRISRLVKSNNTVPAAAFALSWTYENKTIVLTFLGLDSGTEYITTITGQV